MLMAGVDSADDSKSAVLKRCATSPFVSREIMQKQLCPDTCLSTIWVLTQQVHVIMTNQTCLSQECACVLFCPAAPFQGLCCVAAALGEVVCQEGRVSVAM